MNTAPVITETTKPSRPNGTRRWIAAGGMPLPRPSTRRSNSPTLPTSSTSPMKCSDSQIGHAHPYVKTKFATGVASSHSIDLSTAGAACSHSIQFSMSGSHRELGGGEVVVRVSEQPAGQHGARPQHERRAREAAHASARCARAGGVLALEEPAANPLHLPQCRRDQGELQIEHGI